MTKKKINNTGKSCSKKKCAKSCSQDKSHETKAPCNSVSTSSRKTLWQKLMGWLLT